MNAAKSRTRRGCHRARGRQGRALRVAARAAILDRRCARWPVSATGRDERMLAARVEQKNGAIRLTLGSSMRQREHFERGNTCALGNIPG